MIHYDVLIVGGGPAGATTAALTARAGLSTLVLERTHFPREKVCGDCLNPGAWKFLDRLGVSELIDRLPSAKLRWVEFLDLAGRSIRFELPDETRGERGIRRKLFDDVLINHAISCGCPSQIRISGSRRWKMARLGRSARTAKRSRPDI